MDKSQPAIPPHVAAAYRWVELSVAMAMVKRADAPLTKAGRQEVARQIIGRWRGNRAPGWTPSVADLDGLFESTTRWLVENTDVKLFD